MARFVPITVEVDDSKATPRVKGLSNAFDDMDKSANKASTGGLKNAFDTLSKGQSSLGTESAFVREQWALLQSEVAQMGALRGEISGKLTPSLAEASAGAAETATQIGGASAALLGFLGPLALVIAVLPVLATGLNLAAFKALDLAKHAADVGTKIHKAQQETNFEAETLSTLSVSATLSGSSFEGLSAALVIFDKNITRANESDTRLAKQLRDSNVDISNNERALRSIFRVLNDIPDGAKQVELANLAFGASGREVLAIVKETNGDLDEATKKYAQLGLILSGDATKAANKFSSELDTLNLQIDAVKVRLGQQLMPVVSEVTQRTSRFIQDNRERWIQWADSALESARNIKTGTETIIEGYVATQTAVLRLSPAFLVLSSNMEISLGTLLKYGTGAGLVVTVLERLGAAINAVRGPSANAVPAQDLGEKSAADFKLLDLAPKIKQGGFTKEQLADFEQELRPFQQRLEAVNAQIDTFGETSHFAAEKQYQLKHRIEDLSPEVQDQARKFNELALAQARHLDELVAQKKAADEEAKVRERAQGVLDRYRTGLDALIQQVESYGTTTHVAAVQQEYARVKTDDLTAAQKKLLDMMFRTKQVNAEILDERDRQAKEDRETAAANQFLQQQIDVMREKQQSLAAQTTNTTTATEKFRLTILKFGHADLFDPAKLQEAIKQAADLTNAEKQFSSVLADAGRREAQLSDRRANYAKEYLGLQKNVNTEIGNLELDLALLRQQNSDNQFVEQRRLLAAKSEELQLLSETARVQDEIATGPYNESLRIQLALLHDIADVRRRDEDAIKRENRARLELADAEVFHAQQARAIVLDHLAQSRTETEVFADALIDAYDGINDAVLRGVEKLTGGIRIVDNLIAGLITRLTNRLFQKLLDVLLPAGQGGPTAAAAPGGFLNLFRPGSSGGGGSASLLQFATGGFAGGPGAGQYAGSGLFSQYAGSGLFGVPSLTPPITLTAQLAQQAALGGAIQQASAGGLGAAAAGALSSKAPGLGSTIGGILPFLGLGVGANVGGSSALGQILGGAGGLIAGGIGAAFLAPGLFASTGILGSFGPAIAGLLTNPFTAIAAGALLIGAFAFSRNAARRHDERSRNQSMVDSLGQLNQILAAVKSDRMDGGQAIAAAVQVRAQYLASVGELKDKKTREIALKDVSRLDLIIGQIRTEADRQLKRKEIDQKLVPEFNTGGVFKSDFFIPRAARGLFELPGTFDRQDDLVMRVSRGETVAVMTPQQYGRIGGRRAFEEAGVPALASGGFSAPSREADDSKGPIVFNVNLSIPGLEPGLLMEEAMRDPRGYEAWVRIWNKAKREGKGNVR